MSSLKQLSISSILLSLFVILFSLTLLASVQAQDSAEQVKYTTQEKYDENFPPPPTESLLHNGVSREYILYIPESYDGRSKMPLLLNFHGFGGMAKYHYYTADMRAIAESGQFMLVYPQGTLLDDVYGQTHWNAGLDRPDNKSKADDFGFINTLIDKLSSKYLVDKERVYAIGYSNGGYFSYALACYHSDRIAAIASVSGTMMLETHGYCKPTHPTGILNIHGTKDLVVPYYYDSTDNLASIEAVLTSWANFNSGGLTPLEPIITSEGSINHYTYKTANNDIYVEHYKVVDGEHIWFDFTFNGVSTNQLIWDFVSRYDINGLR